MVYDTFLKAYDANTDDKVTIWWIDHNLAGEQAPGAAGKKERFRVAGVPAGAAYFAVRAFDDSSNRSPISNVAEAGGR